MGNTRDELVVSINESMASAIKTVHAGPGFRFGESRFDPPQARILFLNAARGEESISVKQLALLMGVTSAAITSSWTRWSGKVS